MNGDALSLHRRWQESVRLLRERHAASVGGNVSWSWSCSCGEHGAQTTQGRAVAGMDRHLTAQRKRIEREIAVSQ